MRLLELIRQLRHLMVMRPTDANITLITYRAGMAERYHISKIIRVNDEVTIALVRVGEVSEATNVAGDTNDH